MSDVPPTAPAAASVAGVPPTAPSGVVLPYARACAKCSYNLRGLPVDGVCPECGHPVFESLRSKELRHASPEYLASLHKGVVLILLGIAAQFVVIVGVKVLVWLLNQWGTPFGAVINYAPAVLRVGAEVAAVCGWWLFTVPDPAHVGEDQGQRARRLTRVTAAVAAGLTLIELVVWKMLAVTGASMHTFAILMNVVFGAAFIAKFFASMVYVRWLAPRIPSAGIDRFAATLMWLGPVVFVIGFPLFFLGPLATLVLYFLLLDMVRRELARIRSLRPVDG